MKNNPCRLTYSTLIYMRESALWAVEIYNALGIESEAIRYYRILNYIEYRMGKFVGDVV